MKIIKEIAYLLKKKNKLSKSIKKGLVVWDEHLKTFYNIKDNKFNATLLCNIEKQKNILYQNTLLFAEGKPANNALLWGARGTGKSSLVLAVYQAISSKNNLSMIEIKRNQIYYLSSIIRYLEVLNRKFIIFCDDFSFLSNDKEFVMFKSILDGSASKSENFIYYVTSNYRGIIKKTLVNNNENLLEQQETIDDETALSDRFGLWIGFNKFDIDQYIAVVDKYSKYFGINIKKDLLHKKAIRWSLQRGSRSGREAFNFVKSLYNKEL